MFIVGHFGAVTDTAEPFAVPLAQFPSVVERRTLLGNDSTDQSAESAAEDPTPGRHGCGRHGRDRASGGKEREFCEEIERA